MLCLISPSRTELVVVLVYFSLNKVSSALANIAISHRILFCAREVALSEKSKYHSVWL